MPGLVIGGCRSYPKVNCLLATKSLIECAAPTAARVRSRVGFSRDTNEKKDSRPYRAATCLSGERIVGLGKVVDISSKGVRFTTEGALHRGTRIELSVNWPARLNGTSLMKLMIYGCVVRSEERAAAIKIEHHEFRTRASGPVPDPPEPLSSRPKTISHVR